MSHILGSTLFSFQQQINLQKKMRLTGIITQGASRIGTAEYIKAFKVSSSFDGKVYTTYRMDGQSKDMVSGLILIIILWAPVSGF